MTLKINLNEKQKQKLLEFQALTFKHYGQLGLYDYIYTPNGVSHTIKVRSQLSDKVIDLTEY